MTEPHPFPHSREAEEALIGSVLVDPETIRVLDILPDDFYLLPHRSIWQAFRRLEQRSIAIDFVTVVDQLRSSGELENAGGESYLVRLINACATSLHAEHYAEIVKDKAYRRSMLKTASDIAKAAYDNDNDPQAAVNQSFTELITNERVGRGAVLVEEYAALCFDEIDARANDPREVYGIPTGFDDFDRITGGLQKKELIVLSGEPGVGKTLFLAQLAAQAASGKDANGIKKYPGIPGAIYELEMGGVQLVRRMVAAHTGIGTRNMRSGRIREDEWSKLIHAIEEIAAMPLYISDSTAWTTATLRGDLIRLKAKGVDWFIVDYSVLLQDKVGRDNNEIERTDFITKALRQTAKDLDMAAIMVHTMNKKDMNSGFQDKRARTIPSLSSLRSSGQVPYHADIVMFMTKHIPMNDGEMEDENLRTLLFAKWREADSDRYFNLVKKPGLPAFGNAIRVKYDDLR
jgi:replicative DNA helicase